jgi:hypothetical protein
MNICGIETGLIRYLFLLFLIGHPLACIIIHCVSYCHRIWWMNETRLDLQIIDDFEAVFRYLQLLAAITGASDL